MDKFFVICIFLFAGCAPPYEPPQTIIRDNLPLGTKSVQNRTKWDDQIDKSQLIITGSVEEIKYVVDKEKLFGLKDRSSEGLIQLPNINAGVIGLLYGIQVDEVFYSQRDFDKKSFVYVYVKDGYFPATDSNIPVLSTKDQYFFFLSELNKQRDEKVLSVIEPQNLKKEEIPFDSAGIFEIIEMSNSYFKLNRESDNTNTLIKEIRTSLRRKTLRSNQPLMKKIRKTSNSIHECSTD